VARAREREAKALLASNQWSGAYYLSGYAVECGLKSVLVKQFKTSALPDKRLVNDAYQHNLQALVGLAGLTQQQSQALNADPLLRVNWSLTKDWTEASRYRIWTQLEAEEMVSAITDRQHGVMKWLRSIW